jgi:hypothetical protein
MPSKLPQIQFRDSALVEIWGDRAASVVKKLIQHPHIRESIENSQCPMCGKSFEDCEYFRNLDND